MTDVRLLKLSCLDPVCLCVDFPLEFKGAEKVENVHFSHILMDSFQVHFGGVKRQNYENCAAVQILMYLTVRWGQAFIY